MLVMLRSFCRRRQYSINIAFIFHAIGVALWLQAPYTLQAEEQKPVYVVDLNRVLEESIAGKAVINDMKDERRKKGLTLEKLRNEVLSLEESLEKQAALLSDAARDEKREQLEKKQRDFARATQDAEAELLKKNQIQVRRVLDQIELIVHRIAKDKEAQFVLDEDPRVVVYAAEDLQLTEQVIEEMNEQKLKG